MLRLQIKFQDRRMKLNLLLKKINSPSDEKKIAGGNLHRIATQASCLSDCDAMCEICEEYARRFLAILSVAEDSLKIHLHANESASFAFNLTLKFLLE